MKSKLTSAARCAAAAVMAIFAMTGCGSDDNDDPGSTTAQSTPWPGGTWTPGPVAYGSAVDSQLSVTMSDGVILKVDVSYPTDLVTGARVAGQFPVILTQTPYLGGNPKSGDYFVQRGYIFVTAYVRGTTTSGGTFGLFSARDATDGAELVTWAATQLQNSNGVIGLKGDSYAGLNQVYTVAALGKNSPVKAMQASCMGAEFYRETYFAGGIPTQTENFINVVGNFVGGNGGALAFGQAGYVDITSGGDSAYFRDFWMPRTPGAYAQQLVDANVPILLWSTDGDIYAESSLSLYAYLQNAYNKQPVYGPMPTSVTPTGRYQIIISQGGHCAGQDQRIALEWFDTWLKNVDTGMDRTKMPMHLSEQVSNRWFNTSHYPLVGAYTKYYLDNGGALSATVPTNSGQENIAWDQPANGAVLQYDSPVFAQGGTIAGPISASVYAQSTTTNLELIATLSEIASDGITVTKVLSTGAVLGSMSTLDPARSWTDSNGTPTRPYGKYDADIYVPAGTAQKYDFLIYARFASITPGNKLRLTITTQTPTAKCSPVLGVDPCFPTAPQTASLTGATFTLLHGPTQPSSINLPLLPASCWVSSDNPSIPFWEVDPKVTTAPCQSL
jgi:predicted acyl esterase